MVLDLLPLHRQIRTCHGFIRSLVNDGGNTGGGSRQRRTTGDKSRFPTSTITRPAQILRVYNCIYIYIYISLAIGVYIRKNRDEMPNESHRGEARCDAKLTRRRLGALACLLAGEYCRASFSCRCVIVDDGNNPYFSGLHSVKSMTNARNPFGKLARQVYRYPSSLMTIQRIDTFVGSHFWRGKNVEKYRFTVYLFTRVYET